MLIFFLTNYRYHNTGNNKSFPEISKQIAIENFLNYLKSKYP
jgi:hypothetical protein